MDEIIKQTNGNIYMAGSFSYSGETSKKVAVWDGRLWSTMTRRANLEHLRRTPKRKINRNK